MLLKNTSTLTKGSNFDVTINLNNC